MYEECLGRLAATVEAEVILCTLEIDLCMGSRRWQSCLAFDRFECVREGLEMMGDSNLEDSDAGYLYEFCGQGSKDSCLQHIETSVKAPRNRVKPQQLISNEELVKGQCACCKRK